MGSLKATMCKMRFSTDSEVTLRKVILLNNTIV